MFVCCIYITYAYLMLKSQPTAHMQHLSASDFPSFSPASSAPPISLWMRLKVSSTLKVRTT